VETSWRKRTDLALEARELLAETGEKLTELPGVRAREERWGDWLLTRVQVLDEEGARHLGKPVGDYITLELQREAAGTAEDIHLLPGLLAQQLRALLPSQGTVLVAGLGNRRLTADAVGPLTLEQLLVTRHLQGEEIFSSLRPVAAIEPGVLAVTGCETAEFLQGLVEKLRPAALVVVDALAARRPHRLCRSVQIGSSGLTPGSGVGNHRQALNEETLGIPVIAVGVPTVVETATLLLDALEQAGAPLPEKLPRGSFVTPEDIDLQVERLGRFLGRGITLALQPALTEEDLTALLG